jgi:hypothetical protein
MFRAEVSRPSEARSVAAGALERSPLASSLSSILVIHGCFPDTESWTFGAEGFETVKAPIAAEVG